MSRFTPVSSMVQNNLPDFIGVDQLRRRNALADMEMQVSQQNAENFQRSTDLNAQRQQTQINAMTAEQEAARRAQHVQVGQRIIGFLDANEGKPEFEQVLQSLQQDPESMQVAQSLGVDVTRLSDRAYRTAIAPRLGMEAPKPVAQLETINTAGGGIMQRDPVTGKLTQVVAPRAPAGGGGPRQLPSSVEEFRYFQSLPPAQQADYLRVKRGDAKPSSAIEKRLFDVQDAAFKSRANVSKYEDIAAQLEQALPAGGVRGSWAEKYKEIVGSQDAVTELRTRWNEIRVSAAISNLPPGVASDKDIELAMSAFLPANANAATVASFLRGLSKIEALKADYHEFESDYLSNNKSAAGLNKAWKAHAAETYSSGAAGAGAGAVPADIDAILKKY